MSLRIGDLTIEEFVFLHEFDDFTVMGSIYECLGVKRVVHVGAKEFHPAFLNHLEGLASGTIAIEANKGEDVDLEVYSHVFKLL